MKPLKSLTLKDCRYLILGAAIPVVALLVALALLGPAPNTRLTPGYCLFAMLCIGTSSLGVHTLGTGRSNRMAWVAVLALLFAFSTGVVRA
ncbi:hypothetical protein [Ramlibacter alkalitolerans]|uniref:Uncharacterized protein n=1 Tax=Ramlibacter alkalitolerans TaxID=2039631 RepID=A0ABS1JUI0_9BURK|nr:hypothetical protein [Ramlibacter alkalitolerans]MBL0427862.1 hypothetical protein [Ramlibacter alkalitolerans]